MLLRRQRRRVLPSAYLFVGVFASVLLGLSNFNNLHNLHHFRNHFEASSHPLSSTPPHRSLLRRPEDQDLTFLSFGGDSYTELLAETVISDDYMDLAVACTQSIVGNDVEFDAVTLPLDMNDGTWSPRNRILVDRIRKRFPTAVIVLVELQDDLSSLTLYPTSETFSEWRSRTFGLEHNVNHVEMAHAMMQDANKVKGNWITKWNNEDKRLRERRRSDPLLVTYRLDPTLVSVADALDFLNLFDHKSLSQMGHRKVADDIHRLVQTTRDRTVKLRKDREVSSMQSHIKSWGTGDDCHLWLVSGDVLPSTAELIILPQRTGQHKHALEFRKFHSDSVTIHNPFPTERMLFLTYLTDSDSMTYSSTRVFVNGHPTVQIEPFHDQFTKINIHLARSAGVGLVPPGTSTIVLEPMTDGLPFRLVGASILAQEAMELSDVEFELEREHVVQTNLDAVRSSLHKMFRR